MQSFRTELELVNHSSKALVEKDIIDLDKKIKEFRDGKINDEKFRSLRLARGVYGQRQQGVQMIRIKLPFGKISTKQLMRIANISDEYSNGNLHLTTRQDIQIHHVSLDRTPELSPSQQAEQAREEAEDAREQAEQARDLAEAENVRLRRLLEQAGIRFDERQ